MHMHRLDEGRNVSPRGRYPHHHQLRPLPGATADALGLMSPDWSRRPLQQSRRHVHVQPYMDKGRGQALQLTASPEDSHHDEEKAYLPQRSATASFDKQYYFAHQLQETIGSLTQSGQDDDDEEEDADVDEAAFGMEQQPFMGVADENVWRQQRDVELAYVE